MYTLTLLPYKIHFCAPPSPSMLRVRMAFAPEALRVVGRSPTFLRNVMGKPFEGEVWERCPKSGKEKKIKAENETKETAPPPPPTYSESFAKYLEILRKEAEQKPFHPMP